MPKWIMIFLSVSIAGTAGFIIGSLQVKKQRTQLEATVEQLKKDVLSASKKQAILPAKQVVSGHPDEIKSTPSCIFELNKPKLIAYCQEKGFQIGPEQYMDQVGLTVMPLPSGATIRLVWDCRDEKKLDSMMIEHAGLAHEYTGSKELLEAWKVLQPDLADLFQAQFNQLQGEYLMRSRWYRDTEFAYNVALNNKTYIEYIGPQSAIPELQKQYLECATIVIGWYNQICQSQEKIQKAIKNDNPDIEKIFEQELSLIENYFDNVTIKDLRSDWDISDPTFFNYDIPTCWNPKAHSILLRTAGSVERLAFLAQQQWKNNKQIGFAAFDELLGAVAEATGAIDAIWGRYNKIENIDKYKKLPRDYEEKLHDISIMALAVQISRK